jgi:hypothetical protein
LWVVLEDEQPQQLPRVGPVDRMFLELNQMAMEEEAAIGGDNNNIINNNEDVVNRVDAKITTVQTEAAFAS